ncbi:MAG: non-heme iron oxygenase ferredoxin subunit [Gemmatimonadetes bacterium]|nr:non-heme iron oxygenase ferredoxin subunit [Gemmatimonadota bacterium]
MSGATFERVADESDLSDGSVLAVELSDGSQVCLARAEGDVFAVEDRCSHAEFPLSEGEVCGEFQIECALHGATFDLRTGEALTEPAEEKLKTYEVKVENGGIFVANSDV